MKLSKRDIALRRMRINDLRREVLRALGQWAEMKPNRSEPRRVTNRELKELRRETQAAAGWMRDINRAIELNLPVAAAICMFHFSGLIHRNQVPDPIAGKSKRKGK